MHLPAQGRKQSDQIIKAASSHTHTPAKGRKHPPEAASNTETNPPIPRLWGREGLIPHKYIYIFMFYFIHL